MSGEVSIFSIFENGKLSFPLSNLSILASILICSVVYLVVRRNPRIKYNLSRFPGPPTLPILGSIHHLLRQHDEYIPMFDKWIREYGWVVIPLWLSNWIPYACILDPFVAEKVMSTMNHVDKGKHDYVLLHPWLGQGLLTASRKKWTKRRKLLTPSFHFKILENFNPIFNEQASILVDCLKKEADTGKMFNIYPYIAKCTLDVICETAMGKKMNAQTTSLNKEYIDAVNGLSDLLLDKLVRPWLQLPLIPYFSSLTRKEKQYLKILHGFTNQVIQMRRAERLRAKSETSPDDETSADNIYFGKQRKAFLDLLLDVSETEESLTNNDIREEVDTFMFEGHDTTGVNLGWTILMLGMHPEYQKMVHSELDEIFGDNPQRELTPADISRMKYLESCVKESLRLFPSVPFIMRHIDCDIILDDGRIIPENVTAMVGIYYIHRNPNFYSEPLSFKPERFLEDSGDTGTTSKRSSPFSFIPFSAGPRNCIGQKFALLEEKVILAKLFQNYRVESELKCIQDIVTIPDIILRSKNGYMVKLFKR